MTYSAFVVIALIIHIVINMDNFRRTKDFKSIFSYRLFLISIGVYYLTDFFWGVFEEQKLAVPLYIDTFIYFVAMGATILFWTRYVVEFLNTKGWFSQFIKYIGIVFFFGELTLLIINIPLKGLLFTVDENAVYQGYLARNVMLYVQIGLYSLLFIYSLIFTFKLQNKLSRRYLTIAFFSLAMAVAIAVQVFYPYLPIYTAGCLIGISALNTFAINDIKEEYRDEMNKAKVIAANQERELGEVTHLAYSDSLTGVKNKHAYVELEEEYDRAINKGEINEFGLVVFDLNGLKHINDSYGHDAGDKYIIDSCNIIKKYFNEENIYRFGGDEFVVVLKGDEYKNRREILKRFENEIDENLHDDKPVISSGMSSFRKNVDNTLIAVFKRADKIMYARKDILKEHNNH